MTTCIHLPTNARCQVVSRFKDGEGTFYTLKEIVDAGNFARTFTARDNLVQLEQVAEVIQMDTVRAKHQQETTEPPKPERKWQPKRLPEDDGKLRINDPGLTPQELADSIIQGIGPVTAGRILELRDQQPGSKFSSLDDLKSIKGINWKAYAEQISFE